MSPLTPSLRLVVITLVVGCVVASLTGATAKERAADTGLKVAVVNPARIILETKYYKTETDKLSKLQADMQTMVRTWEQNNLLSQADQQTLGELVVQEETKEGLDAGKKAQKQQITDRGKALFGELLTLQTKGQLNQVENDRLREFAKLAADTQKREQDKVNTVKAEIDTKLAAIREATDKNARDSLNKIAKKDGYNLVFSSEVLLYSENDITEKVLTDLNNIK
jgi:Skp family chaperone for outer membrane proteins